MTKRNANANMLRLAQKVAVAAARSVGALMRRQLHSRKRANETSQYDIKLELDVRCQKLIERTLRKALPLAALLGEEGETGDPNAAYRWVVDPIDGTVNFAYTIPHACVSIALQRRCDRKTRTAYEDGYDTVVGVVYDPFVGELWTAIRGGPARLNGRVVRASKRRRLDEAVISIGFAKSRESLKATLPYFLDIVHRVRKLRTMGSAALALTYVATGRFDAYIERGIRLWDIAAGGLILECAGGSFRHEAVAGQHAYRMLSTNKALANVLRMPN
ncbi:MAG TPA: inositol monophosphatase family protein [Verrucomicrobiae bacterium]